MKKRYPTLSVQTIPVFSRAGGSSFRVRCLRGYALLPIKMSLRQVVDRNKRKQGAL